MGMFYELPVYKATYDILVELYHMVQKMPREHKFVLGEKLKEECMEIFLEIYQANTVAEKREYLRRATLHLLRLRVMLRVCNDLRLMNMERFIKLNEKVESVSRQLAGWEKSERKS
ncbi:MAG: four helix bundle protein [Odoribacter sp.]|nr:four helix bundle protein [Odoribacter sp.]